jgi:hypothetical protein
MNINDKAIRKDKLTESSFLLDREYISKRTTLGVPEQLEIDKNLIKLGIVEKPNKNDNCIIFNLKVLTTLMMSTDEDLIGDVKKLVKSKGKSNKKDAKTNGIRHNLRSNIVTTNSELIEAYSDWIDSVLYKDGWMSKQAVISGQSVVDEFSKRNLDVALELINIASLHGYRDMNWAIARYKEQHRFRRESSPQPVTNPQKVGLSSEVF